MKTFMRPLFFIFYLFLSINNYGQTVTGKVTDKTENIAYANVTVTDENNNIITGVTTDDDGLFSLKVTSGDYKIIVSYLGYKNWTKQISVQKNIDLGTILIQEDSESLDEVVIKTEKYNRSCFVRLW